MLRPGAGIACGVLALIAWSPAAAGFFELGLDGEAFDVRGGAHVGKDEQARLLLGGRYSDSDDEDAQLGSVIVGVAGKPEANDAIRFTIGTQVYVHGEAGDLDVNGVGIGGDASWSPARLKGVFFGVRVHFAPESFCWSDAQSILDWGARAGYNLNSKIRVYADYTQVDADLEDGGSVDLDRTARLGFGFEF